LPDHNRLRRIRQRVIDRDGLVCCYCDEFLLLEQVTMDHIVPVSRRGTYNATNLTVACSDCNNNRKSQSFFQFCKKFNWSNAKFQKYKNLYDSNLKIKILNIAKEICIEDPNDVVPAFIINKACLTLKIDDIDFSQYLKQFDMQANQSYTRKKIKCTFENIIKIIEDETL
jgi:hypothetical protein